MKRLLQKVKEVMGIKFWISMSWEGAIEFVILTTCIVYANLFVPEPADLLVKCLLSLWACYFFTEQIEISNPDVAVFFRRMIYGCTATGIVILLIRFALSV